VSVTVMTTTTLALLRKLDKSNSTFFETQNHNEEAGTGIGIGTKHPLPGDHTVPY
jgi:hypothetical protein